MFFTREDIEKIHQGLLRLGIKDSELPETINVNSDDTLAIVQDGKNKKINIEEFFNNISLFKKEGFINITDRFKKHSISLIEAIQTVPTHQRIDGLVITFEDINRDWRIYQFRGDAVDFFDENKWTDLYDYTNYIVKSITPDEEDLTVSKPDKNGNAIVSLKDRVYDESNFSGKGYKILRKNIQTIDGVRKNILTQNMINKPNTIYKIRYDFDLLNTEIELPSNCKLLFCGGSISNGSIILNNTTINCDYSGLKNVSVKGSIANNEIDDTWFDTNSYLNDYKFLKMYFELGQEDKNNGKVYSMHKKYYIDLNDYDNTYSCSSFLGKFFIITQSFIINGNNAEIHVVKDGMAVSVDTAKTGIMRGIFSLLPQKGNQRIDISGILLDGGVGGTYEGDKIGQIPSSFSVNLNRNLISVRRDFEIYYNGIRCGGNYSYGRIVNCIFERSICESIIMMDGAFNLYDKFICRDCVFRNSAGAAYNVSGSSLVENCYFEHLSSGGGIETTLKKSSETIVTNCTFKNVQTICSILDGNNENSFDESSLRNFVFTNCYCENSDSFKELVNNNIYGISLTCVTNATISNCTFVNISNEHTILLHSELNSVNKKYGYSGNVKVISCLFNKSTCIVKYYYSISFENCISVNCPLTVRSDANNLASYFNCKTIYRGIIGNAVKKITFPNNCFMYLSVKASNNYKLGQYIFKILKNDGVGFMVWSNGDEEAKIFSRSEHLLLYHETWNTPQHCTYMANMSLVNAEVTNDSGEIVKTITDVECTYSSRLDNIK